MEDHPSFTAWMEDEPYGQWFMCVTDGENTIRVPAEAIEGFTNMLTAVGLVISDLATTEPMGHA